MRAIQLNINKRMLEGQFQIPIHLAIGHEAVSACLAEAFSPSDFLDTGHFDALSLFNYLDELRGLHQ